MCARGRASNGVSIALRRTLENSDCGHPPPKRFEPHAEQNVFAVPSSGWYVRRSSSPARTRIASVRTRPFAVPTPPESFLQVAQWQKDMFSNSSGSSNRTPPHWQLPRSVATARAYLRPGRDREDGGGRQRRGRGNHRRIEVRRLVRRRLRNPRHEVGVEAGKRQRRAVQNQAFENG